jgi:hypothetical protein
MSLPQLSLVATTTETPAARASRLLAEAREAATEQIQVLEQALVNVAEIAHLVAEGGEVYPVGVRELCRRLAEDAAAKSQTMDAMLQSSGMTRRR